MRVSDEHACFERAVQQAFGAGATVVAIEPLHGDASSRRYVRLRLAAAPTPTVVAMVLGEGRFDGGDELGGTGLPRELPFVDVARHLAAHGLPVPAIVLDRARDDGFLLVEDVGDTSLWTAVEREPARARELFGRAVDLLVRLQLAGTRPSDACIAFSRRFDATLAAAELEHYVDHGIETRHGITLPPDERTALLEALAPLVTPFAEGPWALSHRDYMAWNIHVRPDGDLVLIDFQDALIAPDAFDLAQLLTDRTTERLVDPSLERELVTRFTAGLAAGGVQVTPEFDDRYRRCALQHVFKVIGRFYLLAVVKRKPGYLAYLPSVYAVGRRMLRALPDLGSARPLLARWTPELLP